MQTQARNQVSILWKKLLGLPCRCGLQACLAWWEWRIFWSNQTSVWLATYLNLRPTWTPSGHQPLQPGGGPRCRFPPLFSYFSSQGLLTQVRKTQKEPSRYLIAVISMETRKHCPLVAMFEVLATDDCTRLRSSGQAKISSHRAAHSHPSNREPVRDRIL